MSSNNVLRIKWQQVAGRISAPRSCYFGETMPSNNPRFNAVGGWKARARVRQIVYDRAAAGEVCAICGCPIDVSASQWVTREDGKRIRAPWSLECDEIIPVSLGGSPVAVDNVRPVHRICNQKRGNGRSKASDTPILQHETPAGKNATRW